MAGQTRPELANDILALAQSVGDYRFENWTNLKLNYRDYLGDLQWDLFNIGEDLVTLSAASVLDGFALPNDQWTRVMANVALTEKLGGLNYLDVKDLKIVKRLWK